jgi:hypothetical protein
VPLPRPHKLRAASDDFLPAPWAPRASSQPVTDADLQRVEGSAPNERSGWLRRGTRACILRRMLAATPPRCRVWVLRNASLVRSSSNGRIGRVVSCRNAKCCARAKGLVELIIARNGNQVANNHAYRLRAHSTLEWMTSSCGRPRMSRSSAHSGISCDSANGPEVVPGHFYSTRPAAAPLVGRVGRPILLLVV